MKVKANHSIYQSFVEELVRTGTIATNTGVFTVNGKEYILYAEIKEAKPFPRIAKSGK